MDTGFYRGTNAEQDSRFIDKEKKLLKTMKFEPILDTKVYFNFKKIKKKFFLVCFSLYFFYCFK